MEKTLTPRALGFGMPAEWAPHAATWTAWPYDDEKWLGYLEPVRQEFAAFVNTLARFEPVHLVVNDEESEQDARKRLSGPIRFHRIPHNDLWLRDSGAIFVTRPTKGPGAEPELAAVNWEFNGWGRKYPAELDNQMPQHMAAILGVKLFEAGLVMEGGSLEVNGEGVGLTTRQCLRSPERNPGHDEAALEAALREYLGIEHLVWLGEGLEGDHTDGHIDTLTRFTSPRTIVTSVSDPDDPNHRPLQENLEILQSLEGFQIVELPLPQNPLWIEETRLPLTYANFYIANGAVLVPLYGDPRDKQALEILRPLFPGREVIGLMSRYLMTGGGSFHCVTQQQPQGQVWKG
ncbi:MAG: agmatine deiminase family protein [Meiothermus sp.]|uniref:agmatine deiminase family protein n=1 Tax=Meiothermus sp. TaxID=1955249 RepID=UPI00298F15ED|nr:agmatine deiminase family protein [Meiothermus sp.]MDW8425361.1 agmatine deiminase family protein [Meiothermus sp.]